MQKDLYLEDLISMLRCPYTGLPLTLAGPILRAGAHAYRVVNGIPDLVRENHVSDIDQFFQRQYGENEAEKYDRAVRLLSMLCGCWEPAQRRRLARLLNPPPQGLLLEVSVGTGADLPYLGQLLGSKGRIVGIDLSAAMLKTASRRARSLALPVNFLRADACHLPFADETFDAVFHLGGINMFGDVGLAVREMVRVAKPGAPILIGDEGMSEKRRCTWLGRRVAAMNSLYLCRPPFSAIPWDEVQGFQLHWAWREMVYVLLFEKARADLPQNRQILADVTEEVQSRIRGDR